MKREQTQRLSGWKLRAVAEDRGVSVSYKQFKGYREWGLIPNPEDGGWPSEAVDRLILIRRLEPRQLWRRAVLLQARGYSMDPGALRKAMLRTLPTIKTPKRKMRRIDAVVKWEARKLEDPAYAGMVRSQPPDSTDDHMRPVKWKGILGRRDIDDALFGQHASIMCYFALVLKHGAKNTRLDISSIPEEEVITLLTVRQLAGLARRMEAS